MKKFDDSQSNNSKTQRGKLRKHKNCCPKVPTGSYTLREKDVDSFKLQPKGEEEEEEEKGGGEEEEEEEEVGYNIEHLCYDENDTTFEEEQSVALISSSSEIGESLEELNEEKRFKTGSQSKPIVVDLTADEKKPWKQMILDPCRKRETEREDHSGSNVSEHRIMIADSSSKVNCNGNSSLATALRDRGPCTIPKQPNRSLPIRPAPSVPTRSYRKDTAPLLVLSKSAKPIDALPKEVRKNVDVHFVEQMASKSMVTWMNYVVPQISSVEGLGGMKKRGSDHMGIEESDGKESRKREKSQEADSSQSKEERLESSIKEYLANFCGSSTTTEIQDLCTDKCGKILSPSKEENRNKVVPPLRLRKIVRTADAEGHSKSQAATKMGHESNYTIVTDVTPLSPGSPSSSNWKDMFYEKDTDLGSLKTDSYKLKYRRNRLKRKLQELRSKALELAEQMANDASSQQNTRLRQAMNCYEKQIENLSKLHSKLSAALSTSKPMADVNVANAGLAGNEYSFEKLKESNAELADSNSSASSPEPPKLSPRSPLNYDDMLQQDVRNSPPILPKICLAISSSQDSVDQEVEIAKKTVWPVNEESLKVARITDSFEANLLDAFPHCEPMSGNASFEHRDNPNVDVQCSDICVSKRSANHSKKVAQFSEDSCAALKKIGDSKKLPKEFPPCHFVEKSEDGKCHGFSHHEPITSPAINSLDASEVAQGKEMFQVPCRKEICSPTSRTAQFNSYNPALDDVSLLKMKGRGSNAQKVACNLGQSTQLNTGNVAVNQEAPTSRPNYKGEETASDSVEKTTSSHPLTEQFPTLGNWLARMSSKQTSKSKSKLKTAGNAYFPSAETTDRISGQEVPEANGTNATAQGGTERWQYHSHQQQRQLLQHVASSMTLSQPATTVPSLRPGIYPPISMAQFYPNNYAIDRYNNGAALTYHPAIYPYSTYPYHSRLHSSTLPGYHFPIQDSLRPVQHINKRLPSAQDPMIRYSTPSTSTLQHPSNLEFDRLRGNSVANNIGTSSCLSSLLLTPPTLPTSHQALPRAPLLGYSAAAQFPRNRMVPDVVAAAAAAAVVAAASFDRQRETLTYNSTDKDGLPTAGMTNIIDGQSSRVASSKKPVVNHRDASNRPQDSNINEEGYYENPKYRQMQNFLFDRLALVETTDNFAQANSIIGNDAPVPRTSMLSASSYRVPLISSHGKLSKNVSGSDRRSCETPHLGKMTRSPNSLHNFTCSNCGTVGPKFKCLGCEMAFYCHEQCQEEHWYVHVQKCPKKMPKLKKVT